MTLHRFERTHVTAVPWKNGGGITREIVRRPPDADIDHFDWRVTIAEVAIDGAFSPFEGVDRTIVLLDGAGVVLRSPDGHIDRRLDTPLVPFAFSGDDPIIGSLIGGPSSDFNVMTRRGVMRAEVQIIRGDARLTGCVAGVLFAAHGRWTATATVDQSDHSAPATPRIIDPGTGLWWETASHSWELTAHDPDAGLIAVRVHRDP